jgi:hypothetical protein
MTELRGLIAWLALTVLSTTLSAAPERISRRTRVSEQEPFHSFRILDGKMTLLGHQQDALKSAFNPGQTRSRSKAGISRRAARAARRMNSTAAGIGRIAAKLEGLYQTRHQPFGAQVFRVLRERAEALQRGVKAVIKAQTRSAAEHAAKTLDSRVVSLVVQFQAASGGYGAVRCPPGAWTCCEPKRSKDLLQSERVACIWGCVRTSQTCAGFLGPRIAGR